MVLPAAALEPAAIEKASIVALSFSHLKASGNKRMKLTGHAYWVAPFAAKMVACVALNPARVA